MASFEVTPTIRSCSVPFLNTINVGMPLIPNRDDVPLLSSTLSLTTLALPLNCSEIASTVGASIRHGAHQAAQKSTSTGLSDFNTSPSKEPSVTSKTLLIDFLPSQSIKLSR